MSDGARRLPPGAQGWLGQRIVDLIVIGVRFDDDIFSVLCAPNVMYDATLENDHSRTTVSVAGQPFLIRVKMA